MKISDSIDTIQTLDTKLLFNIHINEKTLNNLVKKDNFPCINYIYHLNNFLKHDSYKRIDIQKHKEIFFKNKDSFKQLFDYPDVVLNKEQLFSEDNCLLSKFSCINLIERILKYGKFKNNIISDYDEILLTRLLILNVIETEVDEEQNNDEIKKDRLDIYLSIIGYNQFSNDINNSNFFRISYLYDNYIKNNIEIEKKFKFYTGYSIKSYLLFLQLFLLLSSHNNPYIESDFLNNNTIANEIKGIISEHLFSIELERNNIFIHSYIPSANLINKPILKFNNKYLVVNPNYLMTRIHGIFFNKIEKTIGDKTTFNRKFYGPMIEDYCTNIAKMSVKRSNYKYYNFIEEFEYNVNNSTVKSSDFYITYNDITIIFEIKATKRFHENTTDIIIKNEKSIDDEFNKKIVEPLNQIEKRLEEIKHLNSTDYLQIPLLKTIQNSKKYYYIVVSDESILNNYSFYYNYLKKVKSNYSEYIPLYLNLSEFEYLMMSLYKRKKAIDKVLDYYHKNYYTANFSDMIRKEKKMFKFEKPDFFSSFPYNDEFKGILKKY